MRGKIRESLDEMTRDDYDDEEISYYLIKIMSLIEQAIPEERPHYPKPNHPEAERLEHFENMGFNQCITQMRINLGLEGEK